MATPPFRTKVVVARGTYANLLASLADLSDGELCFATDNQNFYVKYGGNLVNIVGAAAGVDSVNGQSGVVVLDYTDLGAASAAQGALADSAIQPGVVNPVYFPSQANFPDPVTFHGGVAHSHADGAMYFAHAGVWNKMANTSDIPTNVSELNNDAGYLTTDAVNNINLSLLPLLP